MMFDNLVQDLRRAARVLRASPGLLIVSVLSLGLGLGVNLLLFTMIRAVFFYTPTVANADRVVGVEPGNSNQFSYLNYRDLEASGIFESVAGFRRVELNLRGGDAVERVQGIAVTANFFEMLGVSTSVGRVFGATEAAAERQPRSAVLSYRFWQRRFGRSTAIVGQRLVLNNEPFDVLGVLPESYRPVIPVIVPDIYVPLSALVLPTIDDRANGNALGVLGRLSPGTGREQAQAAVTNLGVQLERTYPQDNRGMGEPGRVLPLQIREFGGWQEPVFISAVLFMLFGLVLLSACANVAGLLLARMARRQREIAVRVALGARRSRLIGMLLAESFGLALAGAMAGMVLFYWLTRAMQTVALPGPLGSGLLLEIDTSVGLYALALVVATGLLCGLVPAWRATRANVVADIQSGDSYGATGRLWARNAFVVGQVAVSIILLVVSSLMLRSLQRITTLDPGFDLDRGLVAVVNLDANRYAVDGGLPLGERIVDELAGRPGVESVSFSGILALGGTDVSATRLLVEGQPEPAGTTTYLNSVGPKYFATLGISIVAGREFDARDRQGSPPVAIVSEAFGRAYFPGESALGKRVRRSDSDPWFEIVGVAKDSKYASVAEAPTPLFYAAYTQWPQISSQIRPVVVHVRTTGAPASLVNEVRRVITGVDPAVFVDVRTLRDATNAEAGLRLFGIRLFGAIGAVALLLAAIGLYGVMAYVVSSRTREIGTRMALGAAYGRILRGVLAQGLCLVGAGIVIGAIGSWMLARALVAALAGLSPADPVAFGGATAVLLFVGMAASYFPARRAASLNPVEALRMD